MINIIVFILLLVIILTITLLASCFHEDGKIARARRARLSRPREPVWPRPANDDIVGPSRTVFLSSSENTGRSDAPAANDHVSAGNDLPLPVPIEAVPPAMPDDVEFHLNPNLPDEEELIIALGGESQLDEADVLSEGLTFEQIAQAVSVVTGKTGGEAETACAVETLAMMPDTMLEIIGLHENCKESIERMLDSMNFKNTTKESDLLAVDVTSFLP